MVTETVENDLGHFGSGEGAITIFIKAWALTLL